MIVDCHAHVSAPAKLWAYKATLLSHRGAHGRGHLKISDDEIRAAANTPETWEHGHLDYLDIVDTTIQLLSPRPFQLMHSEKPGKLVHWFVEECNNVIHRQMGLFPGRFFGIAGLPQEAGEPIEGVLPELERCVNELGFRGCLLNPDPFENGPGEAPPLGDRYWYPLYEKLCELDVPAHIHATSSRSPRVDYSTHLINEETVAVLGLLRSQVFDDFPQLKIVMSHGGGAIPYQLGRWDAPSVKRGGPRLKDKLKLLWFDTVLYTQDALELLLRTVGPERCLFGAECPGVGSTKNPDTGRYFDDLKPDIEAIDWLSDAEREAIFWGNANKVFNLGLEKADG
ncbi:MAG: amidohydrolase family protein [Erythrobacter sp.]|uniref:amidohydrolase family protein n=1 Tax=Erythrobacter sp. TaxID=1042 RepID=UPI002610D5AF|nr:amidohydrolase family protein [Erythrobacter sp.]MDJ0978149.1 amidohydrolase family protein [Erythrobacter sp.]